MLFKKKKVNVDKYLIQYELQRFINECNAKIIISIEVEDNGTVILHTNRPGILIGPAGRDINMLRETFKQYGATEVLLKEMKHIASNCGIY